MWCKLPTNLEMRKLHNIFGLLAIAFLACTVACNPVDLTPIHPDIPGFENIEMEDHCIILRLDPAFSQVVKTKAGDTERGLDPLHENQVNTIDCFFFRTGETDQPAIFRAIGRTVEADTQKDSTECFVKVYYNDDIAQLLFGTTTSGTCDAFVIANASINYDASSTLNQLRESVLEYDFSQQEVQPYFTMCSRETAQVTLFTTTVTINNETKTISTAAGRVPLYRCAAKIQLFLKLPTTFKDPSDGYVYSPCPDLLDGIHVRLASGVKKTYADGDYRVTAQDYIHFDDRVVDVLPNGDLVDGMTDYNYGHVPFYSYPMSWSDLDDNAANFIFSIPWRKVNYADDGKTVTGYGDPEMRYYKLSANVIGRKFEANGFYRTFVYVQSRGDASLDQAEEIDNCYYIISKWVHEGVAAAAGSESISGEFVRYKFLVVEPDEITLNNEADYTFKFSSSADLQNSKVVIDRVEFKKYNTGVAVSKSVTVNDSQSTLAQRTSSNANFIDKNEYSVTYHYGKGEIYFHHDLDEVYEQRDIYLTVTNNDGMSQKLTIHQKPAIMVDLNSDTKVRDVFVDGFFCMVRNATFGNYRTVSYNSSPGPSWSDTYYYSPSGTGGTPGEDLTVGTVSGNNYSNYGTITRGTRTNENPIYTLEISVSAFSADNHSYKYSDNSGQGSREYRIADPRVRAGDVYNNWSVFPYVLGRPNGNYAPVAWDHPEDILITTQALDKQNYIAPRFLVSSTMNGQSQKPGFNNAVKRGAVYQEGGYPAGRWRLPTEAELAFLYARQHDGSIPELFGNGKNYLAASGRYMTVDGSDVVKFTALGNLDAATANSNPSSRFVYDLWYWGDTPAAPNVYHPNGHNTTY